MREVGASRPSSGAVLQTGLGVPVPREEATVRKLEALNTMVARRVATPRCPRVARAELPKGEGSPQPPGMGGVAPPVERFEATLPWSHLELSEHCSVIEENCSLTYVMFMY